LVSMPKMTSRLFADEYCVATEGFSVSYTVQADRTDYLWVCAGGLYVEIDGVGVDSDSDAETPDEPLWHNLVVYQNPKKAEKDAFACLHIIENGPFAKVDRNEGAEFTTTLPFARAYNPIDVEIAYYDEAYYIQLDNTYQVKLTYDDTYGYEEKALNLDKFFASGTRKLGFRSTNTGAEFSNISVKLGNEAALEAIKGMGLN